MKKRITKYIIWLVFIVGGVLLLIKPNSGINTIVSYIGAILLATGVLKILYAIFNKVYVRDNSLFGGIINIIFGAILLFNSEGTTKFISILIATWLILNSVTSLFILLNVKNVNARLLAINIIKLLIGIMILTTPIITWVFTGIFVGIILIFIGIYIIASYKDDKNVYKVKVKK